MICWPLPSNQSFYRQITGYRRCVGDHSVGQWWEGSWANKIAAWPYLGCIRSCISCTLQLRSCNYYVWPIPYYCVHVYVCTSCVYIIILRFHVQILCTFIHVHLYGVVITTDGIVLFSVKPFTIYNHCVCSPQSILYLYGIIHVHVRTKLMYIHMIRDLFRGWISHHWDRFPLPRISEAYIEYTTKILEYIWFPPSWRTSHW